MPATPQAIPEPLLRQVSLRVEETTGLHFPSVRFADLERGLAEAAREAGSHDARAYAESLLNRPLQTVDVDTLAASLTVGETHFFRDPRAFAYLETTLLPELIAAKRGADRCLRLWSAGCASGEEPYSLAMVLHRLLPDLKDWSITILGTDINPKALARAATGVYTEWSFRDTPEWVKPRCFTTRADQRYEIQPWLKRMVRFACLNLVDESYPAVASNTTGMDLIICRNVLLYFAPVRTVPVVERFHRALVAGGALVIGAVEASQMTFPGFTPIPAPSVALFRKEGVVGQRATVNGERSAVNSVLEPTVGAPPVQGAAAVLGAAANPPGTGLAARAPGGVSGALRDSRAPSLSTAADSRTAAQRARACADQGELAEALVWCDRALAGAKTAAALHFLRAGILQELQRDAEALLALRNVLFLAPDHVLAHFAMATIERRQGRRAVAAKHLSNARQLLAGRDENEELPDSGGLTVGRLAAMLTATHDMWTMTDAAGGGRQA